MENIDNILYIALEVEINDKIKLISKFSTYVPTENWTPRFICDHMTLAFHTNLTEDIISFAKENEGKKFNYTINKIGISEKAIAFGIITDVPSVNKNKHITLAINKNENGKPVDSNFINFWQNIDAIELTGTIVIHNKK